MEGSVAGVRILPAVVQFHDADPGVLHQMSLKVQNLSKFSKSVRFHVPDSKFFSLKVKNPDKPIAPGLDVTALVEYYTDKNEDQQDRAILVVDNDIIEIPLIAFSPCPQMEICGPVNFGSTVADGKIITGYFSIDNYGSKSGEFKIKYNGKQPFTITPTSGIVEAETSQKIKVEFISKTCGEIKEILNIKLEGQESGTVEVLGNVVERNLELLNIENNEAVDCIIFGPTFYGTDQVQPFLLYNNGPDLINYVVILDEGTEGQEVGLDLTKNAMTLVASQPRSFSDHGEDDLEDITSLVTVFPNQGSLGPGETCVLNFTFSPRFQKSNYGWKNSEEVAPRKDYALFMNIEAVGSIKKNNEGTLEQGCKLELGVRGTAIPVDVTISPGTKYLFDECYVGEQLEALCTIKNNTTHLPVQYSINSAAHFHPRPLKGLLKPTRSTDVMICFKPNQMGKFNSKLEMNFLGTILDSRTCPREQFQSVSSVKYKQVVIHTLYIHVQGKCIPREIKSAPLRGGRTTLNYTSTSSSTALRRNEIAQPDDRATSIRPADKSLKIKTKFTGIERYSYVDPDFAFTEEEERRKQEHNVLYLNYIRDSRAFREFKSRQRNLAKWQDDTNLGIKPADGLKPPKLSTKQAGVSEKVESNLPPAGNRLLSTKCIATARKIVEGLNAVPLTDIEKMDCNKVLTPQELKKIEIESAMIDFGEVCQRSVKTKFLTVSNNLDHHIHIVVKIDCRELRQSSPLSQVIPPHSITRINLLFESNTKGTFERSIDYMINNQHYFHLVTTAQVVPVALELSCEKLILKPTGCMAAESGFRGVVTIKNKKNLAVDFTWRVLDSNNGTSFSIRPAKGNVEAYSSLDCEVVFYPSYSCSKETQFGLHVEGGNEPKLLCKAEYGPAQCSFVERRFVFGCVPLHLTTVKSCHLKNTGPNHAYFQIAKTEPLPGMIITPKEGVVPIGGTAEIKVEFTPNFVQKLDTEIEVNVLGWKTISLRVGGTVEEPCVDVGVTSFNFHGVYCKALAKIPFQLVNKARSKAKVVFDLSRYPDFSLDFLHHNMNSNNLSPNDGVFTISLHGSEVIDCVLKLKPTEVASYNFTLPVTINDTIAPCPAPSTIPPSPAPSKTNWTIPELDTPPPIPQTIATPSRRVIATALRPPLQLSHSHLKFSLPPGYFDLGIESGAGRVQSCMLVNNSNKPCQWSLDLSSSSSLFNNNIFTFLQRSGSPFAGEHSNNEAHSGVLQSGETLQLGVVFSPSVPGVYRATIPLILNNDHQKTYRVLELEGELLSPEITFEPKVLDFKVVPLAIESVVEFEILVKGYRKSCDINHELPEVEMNDGNYLCLLDCTFPQGNMVTPCLNNINQEPCRIACKITFKSYQPVSFSSQIVFTVEKDRYYLPVRGTADNCLFTNYPFLAAHRNDYHIICTPRSQDKTINGDDNTSISTEAFLLPCITPTRSQTLGSTSATSTAFGISSSSYEDSTIISGSMSDSTPSPTQAMIYNGITRHNELELNRDLDSSNLADETTPEESIFFKEVLKTIQRWFSLQAWSSGPYPIKIPKHFQNSFKVPEDCNTTRTGSWDSQLKGDCRTIFQLVAHMCGRYIPGIPVNVSLPSEQCVRVKKLHWMYSALLVFLRAQGALLAHINPEDLMSFADYAEWKIVRRSEMEEENDEKQDSSNEDHQSYEKISCRAWTDLLLQLLKVFLLGRVTPQQFKKVLFPPGDSGTPFVNPDPLSSNIYSIGERILLAWVNHHYKEQKQKTWGTSRKGSLPSARWIVNFDLDFMDGLVLAALLAAHCPFLIVTHLQDMFLHPTTAEQCLHNAVQVVEAFKVIHLDYDVVPTDITEANPVAMLLLSLHLYQHLPQYIPRNTADFTGSLHSTITRHVQLQNPSSKPLIYTAVLCGPDASDFTLPMGDTIQISSKVHVQLPVEFKSRFLRPCNATLVLIGKRSGTACGTTLVFTLRTCIDNITPRATIKCESPLYEINKIELDVSNPFHVSGSFRVVLVEARGNLAGSLTKEKKTKSKTKKPIESKTDHGQSRKQKSSKKDPILPETPEKNQETHLSSDTVGMTRGFWCSSDNIHLDANGHTKITINFVPFQLGTRQCSVLLINEEIGEFLYLIETQTILPLPSRVPYVPSAHSVRVSSSLAALNGRGIFGGDDRVLYWKCDNNKSFTETIRILAINLAKESALATVGQQNMSQKELRRRELTNTLGISSVTTAMSLLGLTPNYYVNMDEDKIFQSKLGHLTFKVESSSSHFLVPATIKVPFETTGSHDNDAALVVQFNPTGPGHYPAQITLKSPSDVRVYQIECTVSPGGLDTELEFVTPLHQSVTQEIPLVNHTKQDWHLVAAVEGEGFYGPPSIIAKGSMTSFYPLMFRPVFEDSTKGKLVLTNAVDGTKQVYQLKGFGDPPIALEHVIIECETRQKAIYKLSIPKLKKKMTFNVVSDLAIITGSSQITTQQNKTTEYELTVSPWKRGVFTGVVSFMATELGNPQSRSETSRYDETDSSDDEHYPPQCDTPNNTPNTTDRGIGESPKPYRFWYSIEIRASPPPPEKILDVRCPALSAVSVEITVSNPAHEKVLMNVLIEGDGVFGQPVVELDPKQQTIYQAKYAPTLVGKQEGSLIFQHESVGEFWYKLNLIAEQPEPKYLPSVQSELGRHSHQTIHLENPTTQTLLLTPYSSNQRNFILEVDNTKQLIMAPHSIIEVPLRFTPSQIGLGKHKAKIVFRSEQLGDWSFIASGTGLSPSASKPLFVHGQVSENSSLIVPFRNPTEHTVVAQVNLKENNLKSATDFLSRSSGPNDDSAFCLLLKHNDGILLKPQELLDIPLTFTPTSMKSYEATVTVTIQTQDHGPGSPPGIRNSSLTNSLTWIFPVKGIPVSHALADSRALMIECQSRDRTEQIIELTLSGIVPSSTTGLLYTADTRAPSSLVRQISMKEVELHVDNVPFSENFSYEFLYNNPDSQNALERSLGIQLEKKYRNKTTGVVTLIFRLIFSPYKPFSHLVHLILTAGSGGVWKFPVRFVATEAEVDDTITVEAVGLNKEAVVGFRLTSQCRQSIPFIASLTPETDKEFSIKCSSELLLPQDSEGTLIKIKYKPTLYGKIHKGKVIVQTADMQWTYGLKGVTPEYTPPAGQSVITTKHTTIVKQRKKNYVRDNLKLQTTAVSSPIKGAPLMSRAPRREK